MHSNVNGAGCPSCASSASACELLSRMSSHLAQGLRQGMCPQSRVTSCTGADELWWDTRFLETAQDLSKGRFLKASAAPNAL